MDYITYYFVKFLLKLSTQVFGLRKIKMNHRTIAEQIFLAGVDSVLPERLITKAMSLKDNCLVIGHLNFLPECN